MGRHLFGGAFLLWIFRRCVWGWLKVLTGFKQREKISVGYFDMETLEMKESEMFVEGYKAALVKDTSFKGLWKVSFTLKEF